MKLIVAALLVVHLVNAQEKWSDGVAVLNNGEVITGKFAYNHDVLLSKAGDHVDVLPSLKVKSFRFYDIQTNVNRHFVSLASSKNLFSTPYFYEVVVWGNTSVVRKQRHIVDYQSKNKEADHFDYFVLINRELIPLRKFRTKVYPRLLFLASFPLMEWVTQHKLNPNHQADAIRIIQQANKIPQEISIAGL
jgi:hypothetical protein